MLPTGQVHRDNSLPSATMRMVVVSQGESQYKQITLYCSSDEDFGEIKEEEKTGKKFVVTCRMKSSQ